MCSWHFTSSHTDTGTASSVCHCKWHFHEHVVRGLGSHRLPPGRGGPGRAGRLLAGSEALSALSSSVRPQARCTSPAPRSAPGGLPLRAPADAWLYPPFQRFQSLDIKRDTLFNLHNHRFHNKLEYIFMTFFPPLKNYIHSLNYGPRMKWKFDNLLNKDHQAHSPNSPEALN